MPKIEGAKGICRMCFEPVWADEKYATSQNGFHYHKACADGVKDLEKWEKEHIEFHEADSIEI